MIDLSLAGLIGAVIGTIVAALAYVPLLTFVERGLRARASAGSADVAGGFLAAPGRARGRYHRVCGHRLLARCDDRGLTDTRWRNPVLERIAS